MRNLAERAGGDTSQHIRLRLAYQGGKCSTCGKKLTLKTAVSDHCHATGWPRAALCRPCNGALGHFEKTGAAAAARVLGKHFRPAHVRRVLSAFDRYTREWRVRAACWKPLADWALTLNGRRKATAEDWRTGKALLAHGLDCLEAAQRAGSLTPWPAEFVETLAKAGKRLPLHSGDAFEPDEVAARHLMAEDIGLNFAGLRCALEEPHAAYGGVRAGTDVATGVNP